jgi:hypothetical protein
MDSKVINHSTGFLGKIVFFFLKSRGSLFICCPFFYLECQESIIFYTSLIWPKIGQCTCMCVNFSLSANSSLLV